MTHTFIGGEMRERIGSFNWSQTPLGPAETWSQSLLTAVQLMLTSRQPIWLGWGPQLVKLYNDPYIAIVGGKHPTALGQPAAVVWREIWETIGPMLDVALGGDEGTYVEAQRLIMERNGYPEETYYTFSYSPIRDVDGSVGGIFCANTDDTRRVIGERQVALLRDLASGTADARTVEEACRLSTGCLARNPFDLPFALIYLAEPEAGRVALVDGGSGIAPGHPAAPKSASLDGTTIWPFAEVLASQQTHLISGPGDLAEPLPCGAWDRPPQQVAVLPLAPQGPVGKAGLLVVGLNPYRLFDDTYQGFLELVAGQIVSSIANAQAYEQERQRAEALAEIDRAKTVFFSNVSHEFRTPLTLMIRPLEDLLEQSDGSLAPDQHEQIVLAHRNARRLLKLVNTLLDFSRIEAGRVQANYQPTDLAAFTAELASVFRSAIERAGLRLIIDCPPLPEAALVDREMWEKIVLNLLSNALKFTFVGEIVVALRQRGAMVELTVRDTGTGIPAEELPRVFERFHRVDGTRGRTAEGSGIGLALIQELARLHDGSVGVSSELGRGSTFSVTIPISRVGRPAEQAAPARAVSGGTLQGQVYVEEALRWLPSAPDADAAIGLELLSGRFDVPALPNPRGPQPAARLLLADDNADMRDYISRLLGQEYEVTAVGDGLAALRAAQAQTYDLLLSDVMMPELDGFGLLRVLRADEQTRELPIILLSARAGEEARLEGMEAGADDYLIKPFSARELLTRVRSLLALSRTRRESEQRFRLMADAAPVLIWLSGPDKGGTWFNKQWLEFVGRPMERELGHGWAENIHPDDVERCLQIYNSSFDARQAFSMEFRLRHYDGEYRWVLDNGIPLYDPAGSFSGYIGSCIDISEQKETEATLRESEERFRNMADHAPVMIWVTEPDGECTYLSQRWYDFTGREPGTSLGFGWVESIHDAEREIVEQTIAAYNSRREAFQIEYRLRRWDGVYRWVIDSAAPRFGTDGQFLGYIGSVIDITERINAEAERERQFAQEQRLRAAAEEASRLKDEFLATVSHELRTPLTAFLGYAQMLQRRSRDEAYITRTVEKLLRSARDQAQLIEDLLDVSGIISGKLGIEARPTSLSAAVAAALDTVRPAIEAKDLSLEVQLSPQADAVVGDPSRLQQVVWNLLSNAAKFTPPGGRVAVRLERHGRYAHLTVSDSGQGISAAFLPFVFDRFRQADSTSTRVHGGLGLGLSIVRHLVELHGGSVRADSPGEGQGATFSVQLPLAGAHGGR